VYFEKRSAPRKPQELVSHNCINLRLPTGGGLYAWEFEKGRRQLRVHVEGQLVFSGTAQMLKLRWPDSAWPMCPKTWRSHISRKVVSSEFLKTGALRFRVTTCITRTAASSPRRLLARGSARLPALVSLYILMDLKLLWPGCNKIAGFQFCVP
jgi:hypothetical protein